ncbi:MAG: DUF6377 domain-containing protein [Candidatus Azobacteroides sp.]|nr:DUF6377 domain-containing protein [Candidatus Azobacteroides sp.]
MKNISVILFFTLISFPCLKAQTALDTLLMRLDETIGSSEKYTGEREKRIEELKEKRAETPSFSLQEYEINAKLYTEYRPFICDSAIFYQNKNIEIAAFLKDKPREAESKLTLSFLMGSSGMYKEAVDLLGTLEREDIPDKLLINYYNTYEHVYRELAYYTQDNRNSRLYWDISRAYLDSLYKVLTPEDELYLQVWETYYRNKAQYEKAVELNEQRLKKVKPGTREHALVTFYRAITYQWQGKTEQEKYYLALSAISDIQSATKDHASLWMLAQILFHEGDIERAYNYIRFSWSETMFYNARLRNLQSADILSMIDETYQAMIEKQNAQLQKNLLLISLLLILLVGAFIFIYRQMKRLSQARKQLEEANNNLKTLNEELKHVNRELKQVNEELKEVNGLLAAANEDLSKSNQIKEVYIGRFIKLCSAYIDKIDSYRRMVNKKITNGQTKELLQITRSQDAFDKEFQELYTNFDAAFLQLFPDFISRVNELLRESERFEVKNDGQLNTELRILALIRLGIDDSVQIAEFIRYSLNTIYNYRSKVKNKAITRSEFESQIMEIN